MGATVEPVFDLSSLYTETEYSRKTVSSAVQRALLSRTDLQSHAADVLRRDQKGWVSVAAPSQELSGSVIDEWSRVGRIRTRLAELGQHFRLEEFLFATILGPIIPAALLEGIQPHKIDAASLVDGLGHDVVRVLDRAPLVEIALVGWFELELVENPARDSPKGQYLRSWWLRRGPMLWPGMAPPSRFYVLHYHVAGVVTATHGFCDARSFTMFLKPSFPWLRAVETSPMTQHKAKAVSIKNISRYAWKMGNAALRNERPFPGDEELIARARFWSAAGNRCRDLDLRRSVKLLGVRRPSDGTWRNAVKSADRQFLASVWPT